MREESLKGAFDRLTPDDVTVERIHTDIQKKRTVASSENRRSILGRMAAIATCLCLAVALPTIAMTIPEVYQSMISLPAIGGTIERFANPILFHIRPLQLEAADAGIHMGFMGTLERDGDIRAYISIEDSLGRIDETMDLYGSSLYWRQSGKAHDFLGYDEQTNRAVYVISATGNDDIHGQRALLTVPGIIAWRDETENLPITPSPEVMQQEIIYLQAGDWAGYGSNGEELNAPFAVLRPTENPQQVLSYVAISAAGFVEGKYHVQTLWDNGVDNHGFLAMKNAQGEWVENRDVSSVSFGYDAETGTPQWGREYQEFIFDIGPEDMEGATLFGDFVGDGEYIEGNWSLLIQMDADSALSAEDEAMILRMYDDLNAS